MIRRLLLVIVLVICPLVAGCAGKNDEHNVAFGGDVTYTDGTVSMEGNVSVIEGAVPPQTYPNVIVVLYSKNRTVLDRILVGDMSANGEQPSSRRISITRDLHPTYVVIESPGFWNGERVVGVAAFHWSENRSAYEHYSVNEPDEKFNVD